MRHLQTSSANSSRLIRPSSPPAMNRLSLLTRLWSSTDPHTGSFDCPPARCYPCCCYAADVVRLLLPPTTKWCCQFWSFIETMRALLDKNSTKTFRRFLQSSDPTSLMSLRLLPDMLRRSRKSCARSSTPGVQPTLSEPGRPPRSLTSWHIGPPAVLQSPSASGRAVRRPHRLRLLVIISLLHCS